MEIILYIGVLVLLLLASAYCSASETALFSLPATRIRAYRSCLEPNKTLIASLLDHPRDLLVTVFLLNTLVNILIQNYVSALFGEAGSWILKVIVPLFLMLVLGELIPKYIGLRINIALASFVAPSINFIHKALRPIRQLILDVTVPVSRLLFFFLRPEEDITKDEMKHVLDTSQQHGVLDKDEAELVWGYVNFQDTTVKELMQPREDVIFYDIEEPLTKLEHLFVDKQCTRIPVYQDTTDNILGIITARQYFLHQHEIHKPQDLTAHLTKPYFVPETTLARSLLWQFEESKQVIALVVDEYGAVSGLITREDLFEVVVGDISDLRDTDEEYVLSGPNEIIASGKLDLGEFNEIFKADLHSDTDMVTLGGWLIEKIGDIPKSGTKFETSGFLFQVLAADPNRIRRLYIRKL